ncbi:AraC family transcriptional regulator [Hydrocarboniclastica marina]|uniref:AraC family transcriptional regulator n=1 Tax=Hydrocarboniclastica marina TaxID=2259620 RepID=A0A4P7XMZ9_9ALTE|nr:AraC family transcriptional regulator [Hydrocarboniclastica marina]MAM59858.1 hypothetical protein [Maritimibacter sp.]QCF28072.1 AraC family transcriptional regulator [Hydrocarboniclastica marina]|tara:strand:+ start:3079 stop:4116 length:1038 start_codon:yes stop_codon:yes gene_type:complete
MQPDQIQIPGQYLYILSECIEDFGISRRRWLEGSGIEDLGTSTVEATVSYGDLRRLMLKAARLADNPALGLSLGQRLSLPSHGILGYALMNCGTLSDAAVLLEKYIPVRLPLVTVQIQSQNDELVLTFQETVALGEIREMLLDALLLTVKKAIDQILPGAGSSLTVCFPMAPHPGFPYASVFECGMRFHEPQAAVRLPKALMQLPIPQGNAAAYREAEALCRRELQRLTLETSYSARIKRKMLEQPGQLPALAVVASWFNLTPRTLHRRLLAEGNQYNKLLEEVKVSLALAYLANSDMSIKEIAYFLGYAELSNFRRAFKRWQRMSPSHYRETQEQARSRHHPTL